jgi:methyl-accepting chemotaxis protein
MNPDINNRDSTTVSSLMLWETIGSVGIPIISLIVAGIIFSVSNDRNFGLYALAGLAVLILVTVIPLNTAIQRMIRERMSALADVCRDYVGGDQTVRAMISGEDEFGGLAASLNMLLDNQSGASASALGGVSTNDAGALQAQIEKLLQEVSAVGDGDLRVQAEVTPDTLGVLADSFNYMIEELAKVVGRVQSTAVQVTNATRRILDRSAELAQASETQVKQIAQTTEAVEALANFIQNVARNAQMSVEAAQDALKNAATGQQAVRQTIEGMMLIRENVQETSKKIKRLGERSNEIGEIVRIIEDIADQTNLLALNAAIQSAMAGEHGRGFAVVADEIRLLAERSTESTKRIATLVKSIQGDTHEVVVAMEDSTQEVVKGSQLADDAGRSLNSIYGAVERQTKMIEDIARAANEQTTVSEAVAVAMSRISEITRQTDAGTQEAAVSVSYLAELSEQLRASVSTFHLPERANDALGSFSGGTSVAEVPDPRNNQNFAPMVMSSGADMSWSAFGNNFSPLPESGNPASLVPMNSMTSRSNTGPFAGSGQQDFGSFAGNGQQDFGRMASFAGNSAFPVQNVGPNEPSNLPSFAGNSGALGQNPGSSSPSNFPSFAGNSGALGQNPGSNSLSSFPAFSSFSGVADSQQFFGGQQDFAHIDNQFSFNTGFSDASFGANPAFGSPGTQGQPLPNPNLPSTASQQPFGQPSNARQRWQGVPPQDQNR